MKFDSILRKIWFAVILLLSIMIISESYAAITVKSVNPKANAINISANSNITVEFDTSLNSATVSVNTFTVNGSVSGFHKGTFSVSGAKIIFDPEKDFSVGETVTIILTTEIKSTGGLSLAAPLASQFTIATTGGIGYFIDSNQSLGNVGNFSAALGDIDNDGNLDAFVTNAGANKIWKNKGAGVFEEGQSMENSDSFHAAFGDFNKDGYIDIFAVSLSGPDKILMNDGKGNFTENQAIGTNHFAFGAVALGDINGDGHLDAFVVGMTGNTVLLNNGTGKFTESQILTGAAGLYVALGDLDNDGHIDAFIATEGNNEIWLNNGKGIFTNSGQSLKDDISTGVALGDIDGDSDLDAFVVNENAPDRVWRNNGKGIFEKIQTLEVLTDDNPEYDLYSESHSVYLGNLDGDSDLDAFVVNNGKPNKVWLNDGTGKFYKGQAFTENDKSWGMAMGDLDRDGDLDLFIANLGEPNKVLLNKIKPGDIDGNGVVDLKDAITGLKILIALADSKGVFLNDVNGDKKIGMEDVSFILQVISLIR